MSNDLIKTCELSSVFEVTEKLDEILKNHTVSELKNARFFVSSTFNSIPNHTVNIKFSNGDWQPLFVVKPHH